MSMNAPNGSGAKRPAAALTERRWLVSLVLAALVANLLSFVPAQAQTGPDETLKPIDMMLVIDNSGSMFESPGNDPDLLRIVGANLFIARLGFAEAAADDYQVGIVSFGSTAELTAPLQPLTGAAREALAGIIKRPTASGNTNIVGALQSAYAELRTSPARRPTNLPAIVLLTDGTPFPSEGQSQADLEKLLAENKDIPFFIMLLQNPASPSPAYAAYIDFWQRMQVSYSHIFTYPVNGAAEIEATYNNIVAQLQNTVPSEGLPVAPDAPLQVFVSRYVQKVVITVIHQRDTEKGVVAVRDPNGAAVVDSEPGVVRFRGTDNNVEVISVTRPRLSSALSDDFWTVESDAPVTVFLDRQGAYRIKFLTPRVSLTDLTNVYLASDRQSPSTPLTVQFQLIDADGQPVLEPQPIVGRVGLPGGTEQAWASIPADVTPVAGVYLVAFDFEGLPAEVRAQPGRFVFYLSAGTAAQPGAADDERSIPIAIAQLIVDVGPGPFIEALTPNPVQCRAGQAAPVSVSLGDFESAVTETVRLRVLSDAAEVELTLAGPGVFTGDLAPLCAPLIPPVPCSTEQAAAVQLRLAAELASGAPNAPVITDWPITVVGGACTATPAPTLTPLPPTATPSPTPIPDSDGDGLLDPQDDCAGEAGLAQFAGCPTPWWVWALLAALGLGLVAGGAGLAPRLGLLVNPPPQAYVLEIRTGERTQPRAIHAAGREKGRNKVRLGGDRKKCDLFIAGLTHPVEFIVEKQGERVMVINALTQAPVGTIDARGYREVMTSNPAVKLRFSTDQSKLKA